MIFKTITDESSLSGRKIVSMFQARKIAQEEVNLSIQKHIAQLELDKAALTQLEQKIASGIYDLFKHYYLLMIIISNRNYSIIKWVNTIIYY